MSLTFNVDKALTDYISVQGFKRRQGKPDSHFEYYSNDIGNQIRINNQDKTIAVLDCHGFKKAVGFNIDSNVIDMLTTTNIGGL